MVVSLRTARGGVRERRLTLAVMGSSRIDADSGSVDSQAFSCAGTESKSIVEASLRVHSQLPWSHALSALLFFEVTRRPKT